MMMMMLWLLWCRPQSWVWRPQVGFGGPKTSNYRPPSKMATLFYQAVQQQHCFLLFFKLHLAAD
jgi:hypothetical protein